MPTEVTLDNQNNVIVVDRSNHRIRKITPDGQVTTVAGSGVAGFLDGIGITARFKYPAGICIDSNDNLYIADYGNHKIRKVKKYGYYITPALPSGLVMDWETGIISGTPIEISPLTNYSITAANQFGTFVFNLTIEVQGTLGTTTFMKNNVTFYPNPVKDKFELSSVNEQTVEMITIHNLLGQKVAIFQKMKMDVPIDVSFLQNGYYSCHIETEVGIREIKFIKQ